MSSEAVIVQVVASAGTVVVALISVGIPAWRKLRQVAKDTSATRAQTENEHADHEYPNLREQLDAIHDDVREARASAHRAESWAHAAAQGNHETDRRLSEHLVDTAPVITWARKQMPD